ncbi:MAG: hypothetical protein IPM38_10555 [Ignavibacteria bacterium]|nr:hypothetical protein [Ignavibacteria bacterium]
MNVFGDKKTWKKIMKRGMKIDFSWKHSAKEYIELYKKVVVKNKNSAEYFYLTYYRIIPAYNVFNLILYSPKMSGSNFNAGYSFFIY